MESTLTVPLPTFTERFRAAWRGEESLAGQIHLVTFEGTRVAHVAVSFIVIVRCLTNVSRKSWEYFMLGYLFALPIGIADNFQKIVDVFTGQ